MDIVYRSRLIMDFKVSGCIYKSVAFDHSELNKMAIYVDGDSCMPRTVTAYTNVLTLNNK